METRIVNSLRYINVDESVYDFQFENHEFVKGTEQLDHNIFNQNLVDQAGLIAAKEFTNYPFVFSKTECEIENLPQLANKSHNKINRLLNFLWVVKDCAVSSGNLYCFIPNTHYLFSSIKLGAFSNSRGEFSDIIIDGADLKEAYRALQQYEKIIANNIEVEIPKYGFEERQIISDSNYHFIDYNKNKRLERALSFLTMARTNSFLPLKISLYMSFLECLFTTDRQEVTHKVCERVALYLGGNYNDKLDLYNSIKAAYDIRSGFFHGQEIEKKQDVRSKLANHSRKVDELARLIFKKVLFDDYDIFNADNEKRKEYFNKLVLG